MISPLSRRGGYFIKCMETNIKRQGNEKNKKTKKQNEYMFQNKGQYKTPETDF